MNRKPLRSNQTPADSIYTRWPVQLERHADGWTVSYHGSDGHVKHVAHAETDIQAYRSAYQLIQLYRARSEVLVRSRGGERTFDIERLMHAVKL